MSRSIRRLTPSNLGIKGGIPKKSKAGPKSSYGGIWFFQAEGGWHGWLAFLLKILSPPPIFERLRENDAEYPKFQTHSVIDLSSNLVEKFSSKNELSIPAEFLYRLWWNHWVAIQSLALDRNIQGIGRRNKYIEVYWRYRWFYLFLYCKRKTILWILLAPKVLFDYLQPMITIHPTHPSIHPSDI